MRDVVIVWLIRHVDGWGNRRFLVWICDINDFFCRWKVVECVEHYHVVGVVIVVSRLKIEDLFAYLV